MTKAERDERLDACIAEIRDAQDALQEGDADVMKEAIARSARIAKALLLDVAPLTPDDDKP